MRECKRQRVRVIERLLLMHCCIVTCYTIVVAVEVRSSGCQVRQKWQSEKRVDNLRYRIRDEIQ